MKANLDSGGKDTGSPGGRIARLFIVIMVLVVATGCGTETTREGARDKGSQDRPTAEVQKVPADPERIAARLRKLYEAELVSAITRDARMLARLNMLSGPILGTSCTPMERGGTPVVADTLHFNCI